jgi:hypothetical protein
MATGAGASAGQKTGTGRFGVTTQETAKDTATVVKHEVDVTTELAAATARVAEARRAYYNQNRERILAKRREHYRLHKERLLGYSRDYYQDNKTKIRAKSKRWYDENRNRKSEYWKEYYQQHRATVLERNRQRYLARKAAKLAAQVSEPGVAAGAAGGASLN